MVDCIIVGNGLAGVSAALTLKSNGKSFLMFGGKTLSAKILKAEKINNYPALSGVSGAELGERIEQQLRDEEIEVISQKVVGVYAMKGKFLVAVEGDQTFESRTVILATGVETIKPIEGEEAFLGRGVSYCATCDGRLYQGKTIAVMCTSKALEHEVDYLASLAQRVYLIPLYKGEAVQASNVERIIKKPLRVEGGMKVNAIVFPDGSQERTVAVDGVFFLKDCVSSLALCGGLAVEGGHVVIERDCSTNIKGLFAAGDCTGRPYQYTKAAGEGNVAAHSAVEYLAELGE